MKLKSSAFESIYSADAGEKIILDVREPKEVQAGALKNSWNIPLGQLRDRSKELSKEKTIYIYCGSGKRAQSAYDTLTSLGYSKLICVAEGGFEDLKKFCGVKERGVQ